MVIVVEEVGVVGALMEVVEHFVMDGFYCCYFHLNDLMMLMIEIRHKAEAVEKNCFEMMNDCYTKIDHNVTA